jgi:hypothetical protein
MVAVVSAERDSLVSYLGQQRESVLDIADGLPEAALQRECSRRLGLLGADPAPGCR